MLNKWFWLQGEKYVGIVFFLIIKIWISSKVLSKGIIAYPPLKI